MAKAHQGKNVRSDCNGPSTGRRAALTGGNSGVHVFDNGAGEFRGAQFFGAFHQPFEVVCHAFLSDRTLDAVFDQVRYLDPAHEFKHHGAGKHHRTRIDHVLVRILGRRAVRRFKHAITVANIRSGAIPRPPTCAAAASEM